MYDGIKQKRKMTKKDLVYHEIYKTCEAIGITFEEILAVFKTLRDGSEKDKKAYQELKEGLRKIVNNKKKKDINI